MTSTAQLVERMREEAHLFELHDPANGVTMRARLDVEAIRAAADALSSLEAENKRLREALRRIHVVSAAEHPDKQARFDQIASPAAWADDLDAIFSIAVEALEQG